MDTRTRAVLVPSTLDLFVFLRSGEEGQRYSLSNLGSLLLASPPLMLFDPRLTSRNNVLFQVDTHGTAPEVVMVVCFIAT